MPHRHRDFSYFPRQAPLSRMVGLYVGCCWEFMHHLDLPPSSGSPSWTISRSCGHIAWGCWCCFNWQKSDPASQLHQWPSIHAKKLAKHLALLQRFGGLDLFITVMANPQWREVREALLPNQSPHNRPDIIAWVFNLKFESVLNDIMQKSIFGTAEGYVYTVKYQKCGLPHMHLIVFLDHSSCISTPNAVDNIISTEFPDQIMHLRLFDIVKKFMVHGPCGFGQMSPCLDAHGKCTKQFLKQFQTHMEITGDLYIQT